MNLNKYLDIAPEVQQALADGRPVVALESTIISHGMPYPKNVETALLVEQTLRDNGAVPATIAILGGRLKAGLSKEEITYLGKTGRGVAKVSRRDLPVICARGMDGTPRTLYGFVPDSIVYTDGKKSVKLDAYLAPTPTETGFCGFEGIAHPSAIA